MDKFIAALAVFNVLSMYAVFAKRSVRRKKIPWGQFAPSLMVTELAWLWLAIQGVICLLLFMAGAMGSGLGRVSFFFVLLSWIGFIGSIRSGLQAGDVVEAALKKTLGKDYQAAVPNEIRQRFRQQVSFADWNTPFTFHNPEVEVIRGIPYAPNGVRQHLDIYRPRQLPEQGCPVLLQIHGGAWQIGDKGHQGLPLMNMLASKGWICVAANYRLSPSVGFPTHLEDCKAALCWIREQGQEYGMDPSFVAVTGGSAGGQLAALMGLTANNPELQKNHPDTDTTVQACVPCYGVYDFLARYNQHPNAHWLLDGAQDVVIHETPDQNPELWDLASPVTQIHQQAPPFMVVHGTQDSIAMVNDARVFCDKLGSVSDNPVVYLELPDTEHAFDCMHSPRTEYTIDGIHRFLEWTRSKTDANAQIAE